MESVSEPGNGLKSRDTIIKCHINLQISVEIKIYYYEIMFLVDILIALISKMNQKI